MPAIVFHNLRLLGATVDVRRNDIDGGFALVTLDGRELSVDVYYDPTVHEDMAALLTVDGEQTILPASDVPAAVREIVSKP